MRVVHDIVSAVIWRVVPFILLLTLASCDVVALGAGPVPNNGSASGSDPNPLDDPDPSGEPDPDGEPNGEPRCSPKPPEGYLDYFPLVVGQVIKFDYVKGNMGAPTNEPSREIGVLRWDVEAAECIEWTTVYRIREAFEGVAQWINRYEPEPEWRDLRPVTWTAELTLMKGVPGLDLGRYALAPLGWAHLASAPDTVEVVQPTGYRGGQVAVVLVRGVGLVERGYYQNSGNAHGTDYETLRRRE
jgi:hypothetical protein